MKKIFLLIVGLATAIAAEAQDFSSHFHNKTLRIDYHFVGNAEQQIVALDELASEEGWAGRRVNLDKVPVRGNGDIKVIDTESGKVLYRNAFSSLFQEWLVTDEAKEVTKSFEATFLVFGARMIVASPRHSTAPSLHLSEYPAYTPANVTVAPASMVMPVLGKLPVSVLPLRA